MCLLVNSLIFVYTKVWFQIAEKSDTALIDDVLNFSLKKVHSLQSLVATKGIASYNPAPLHTTMLQLQLTMLLRNIPMLLLAYKHWQFQELFV